MFDYFQVIDFSKNINFKHQNYSFLKNECYQNIKAIEYTQKLNSTFITFLEREESSSNYLIQDETHYVIYGSVFTNNKYRDLTQTNPSKIDVNFIRYLYQKYNTKLTDYIKGSFILVIYNESVNELLIITDQLNVLPFYYSFKNNVLVLSSSVRMLLKTGFVINKIDSVALTEQMIFDYVIGTKTFFEEISQTAPGTVYQFTKQGLNSFQYWTVESLYHPKLLKSDIALELLSTQLHENVNLYASDTKKILVSLTGGFDGRTNVAMLEKDPADFLCYSYGMPGSKQVEIPLKISEKIGINYKPIYLDTQFEKTYEQNVREAIEFSNGTAPIIRANYPYAYKNLREYSTTILTGLLGSEILRPIYNLGIQMNNHSERLFISQDSRKSITQSIQEIKAKNYIDPKILDGATESIIQHFQQEYFEKYKNYDFKTRFFFFLLEEGLRKYFMQEIQIERVYVTTRFPYFDIDLVNLLYQTPFAGMYNGFLGKSKAKRRKGQLLYAHILRKYKPALGKIELDRGYIPDDLLKSFPLNYLSLWLGVRKARKYNTRVGNDTFNSESWTRKFIAPFLEKYDFTSGPFACGMKLNFENENFTDDLLKYSHLISLMAYLKR